METGSVSFQTIFELSSYHPLMLTFCPFYHVLQLYFFPCSNLLVLIYYQRLPTRTEIIKHLKPFPQSSSLFGRPIIDYLIVSCVYCFFSFSFCWNECLNVKLATSCWSLLLKFSSQIFIVQQYETRFVKEWSRHFKLHRMTLTKMLPNSLLV